MCKTPLLPKDRIERFVVDRIKRYILTEENLEDVVRLTNEELAQTCDDERNKIDILNAEIADFVGSLSISVAVGKIR